jgi:hypothetical protein
MITPILCIPKVHTNITQDYIEKVFTPLGLGKIDAITFKRVTYHTTDCNMVHIRFASWYNKMWLDHLISGNTFKILYDKPRYWICSLSSY